MSRLLGQSDVDAVRDATDLVRLIGEHVALKPKGREHVGLCPFHDDHNPSFAVVTHKGNAFYKCHSCGAGGDVFDFVMNYHKMEFGEALRFLADRAGITLTPRSRGDEGTGASESSGAERTSLRRANRFAASFFQRTLGDAQAGASARAVIEQRGMAPEMVEAFMLGAAPDEWDALEQRIRRQGLSQDLFVSAGLLKRRREGEGCYDAFRNRLVFPICDDAGNPIAFGARKINPDDEPKYLNSAESRIFQKSKTLYALHLAKRAIIESRTAIVTEGYTDVIACHQAGLRNVVATLGTALTDDHARLLARLCETVILLFDGDEAGQKAADRALQIFFNHPVDIRICVLPDGLDPDDLLRQEEGRVRFEAALNGAGDALQYSVNRFQQRLAQATGLSARQRCLEEYLADLAHLGFASMQGVRKQMMLARLGELLDLSVASIESALRRSIAAKRPAGAARPPEADPAAPSFGVDELPLSRGRLLAEHELLSIVIFDPAVARQDAETDGAASRVLEPARFRDGSARAIAAVAHELVAAGTSFTMQQLLELIDDEECRRLASKLYFDGQRLCGEAGECSEAALVEAGAALQACEHRESLLHCAATESSGAAAPFNRINEFINRRRQTDVVPAAISRGVRT